MPYVVQNQVHRKGFNPWDSPQVKILSTRRANAHFLYCYTLTIRKHRSTNSHTVNIQTNTLSLWAIIMIWSWQSYKLVCKISLCHFSWFQLIERLGRKSPVFIDGELIDGNYLKEKNNVRRKCLSALKCFSMSSVESGHCIDTHCDRPLESSFCVIRVLSQQTRHVSQLSRKCKQSSK